MTVAWAFPALPVTDAGGPGTALGVTDTRGVDAEPVPAALAAVTSMKWLVPLVRPAIAQERAPLVVQDPSWLPPVRADHARTVYPVMGDDPGDVGTAQEAVTVPLPAVPATERGTPGTTPVGDADGVTVAPTVGDGDTLLDGEAVADGVGVRVAVDVGFGVGVVLGVGVGVGVGVGGHAGVTATSLPVARYASGRKPPSATRYQMVELVGSDVLICAPLTQHCRATTEPGPNWRIAALCGVGCWYMVAVSDLKTVAEAE